MGRSPFVAIAALGLLWFSAPAASAADAETQAPAVENEAPAATWAEEACGLRWRTRGHRVGMATPRRCAAPSSLIRGCSYVIDIRQVALRYATGRRSTARTVRCVQEVARPTQA